MRAIRSYQIVHSTKVAHITESGCGVNIIVPVRRCISAQDKLVRTLVHHWRKAGQKHPFTACLSTGRC